MTDYARGIEQATALYKEVIQGCELENAKLRELVKDMWNNMWTCEVQRCTHRHEGCSKVHGNHGDICVSEKCWYEERMNELDIEV